MTAAPSWDARAATPPPAEPPTSVGEILVPHFYSPAYVAAHRDELAARSAQIALLPPWWFAAAAELLTSIEDLDLRPVLGKITCPVLVLAAGEDLVMPLDHARALAAAIPDARLEVVAGSGHVLVVEQPERFVQVVPRLSRIGVTL